MGGMIQMEGYPVSADGWHVCSWILYYRARILVDVFVMEDMNDASVLLTTDIPIQICFYNNLSVESGVPARRPPNPPYLRVAR
jgi:hypothetical protein